MASKTKSQLRNKGKSLLSSDSIKIRLFLSFNVVLYCNRTSKDTANQLMEMYPSWDVNTCLGIQVILSILWTAKVHYHATRACQWSSSWAWWIQSTPSHPISLRFILILSSHLCLGLPSGLIPSDISTKILCILLSHVCLVYLILLNVIILITFLISPVTS
jgi:hypothetical protein